jgi:hypothetical protein
MTHEPHKYPDIVSCLVLPFEKSCEHAGRRYEALVFARRGRMIMFAAEYARKFGVGILDASDEVSDSMQYPTFDTAARAFLTAAAMGQKMLASPD